MRTINGKLIIQEIHDSDSIEKQIMNFSEQQKQQDNQEINKIQNHLSNLDKKCILLEEAIARQFIQLLIINICSVIGLIFIVFWFNSNHQPDNQPQKKSTHTTVQKLHK